MRDPLDDITVSVVEPRPAASGSLWPRPPIRLEGSITFRHVRALGPDEFEERRAAGTLEDAREELRRAVREAVSSWLDSPR